MTLKNVGLMSRPFFAPSIEQVVVQVVGVRVEQYAAAVPDLARDSPYSDADGRSCCSVVKCSSSVLSCLAARASSLLARAVCIPGFKTC